MILIGSNVVYKDTLTGLRISTAAGAALIDNAGATVPTLADGNHLIEIYDASGRMIKGFLKAAGDGEDTGSELLTNVEFTTNVSSWLTLNLTLAQADSSSDPGDDSTGHGAADKQCAKATNTGDSPSFRQVITNSIGMLLKTGAAVYAPSANTHVNCGRILYGGATHNAQNTAEDQWVAISDYWTTTTTNGTIYASVRNTANEFSNGDIAYFDTLTCKQVTAPSTSGCTISSTKGGTAMDNWTYKNAAFSYNSSSYYCVVKRVR